MYRQASTSGSRWKRTVGVGAAVAATVASVLLGVSAPAVGVDDVPDGESQEVTDGRVQSTEITFTEETFVGGKSVSTRTITAEEGEEVTVPAPNMAALMQKAGISESAASAETAATRACKKVTQTAHAEHGFGTAYKYNIWTYWCWRSSDHYIYPGGSNGWSISDVFFMYYWQGEVNKKVYFYDWGPNNNRPRSAFRHYRMGQFDYCPVKVGCVMSNYPSVSLRSYGDGSWTSAKDSA